MKVLVAAASKHGATLEIAEALGRELEAAGLDCDVVDIAEAADPSGYDAAILGSGAYAGRWLKPARRYVDDNAATLLTMPVWMFSSGPLGDPLKPADAEAVNVEEFVSLIRPEEHRLFPGALDKSRLSFGERAIVTGASGGVGGVVPDEFRQHRANPRR